MTFADTAKRPSARPLGFRARAAIAFAFALAGLGLLSAPAGAAPVIELSHHHLPTTFQPGSVGIYSFVVRNLGDAPTAEPATVTIELPPGVTTRLRGSSTQAPAGVAGRNEDWQCPGSGVPGQSTITCSFMYAYSEPQQLRPVPSGGENGGVASPLNVFVNIPADASGSLTATATFEAGPITKFTSDTAQVGPPVQGFGVDGPTVFADAFDREGDPERQAGANPYRVVSSFDLNTFNSNQGILTPFPSGGGLRNVLAALPRGFAGIPSAVAECTEPQLAGAFEGSACPPESQIGVIDIGTIGFYPADVHYGLRTPVYNLVPPKGAVAALGFAAGGYPIHFIVRLDPTDHSLIFEIKNIDETLVPMYQRLEVWGVPADPVHDSDRWNPQTSAWGASSSLPPRPFLAMPTECGPSDTTDIQATPWQNPTYLSPVASSEPIAVGGCNRLDFKPTIEARSSTNAADSPTGLDFDLHIPQSKDPEGLATAHLRDAVVTLPPGMTVNPPSADGLGACSPAEIGLTTPVGQPKAIFDGAPPNCPDASKIGTVEVLTPAVRHPLPGFVYLADQNRNPFSSLLAIYIGIYDPQTNLVIKIPGEIKADPKTGQLTATVTENPQLPFEDLKLSFYGGPRAALKTPAACGVHTTTADFTPWSAPEGAPAFPTSSFELTHGPDGGACRGAEGSAPNNPSFTAGTADPTAKAFTPFALKLARADGTQQLKTIDTTLPKGLLGRLAGTTYCSEAAISAAAGKSGEDERTSPSCPASSRVGTVNVGSGAGSSPLYVSGTAYLAGPYKEAPLSLAIVTPAVAGPFDLGTVVVRTALYINPETAQLHAVSDDLPTILQGIPLDIRSVALKMDRPQFTLNPTSCEATKVEGSATSVFGQSAPLSSPFQVGECDKLGFRPQLALRLKGSTKRSGFPALTATLTARTGDANIGKAVVSLPHSEFLAQAHIRTICTRVQYAADQCPAASVYGKATAWSPLLDQPLSGPVYLRSSSNRLPDLVAALNGQIDIDLVGRIDSFKGGIRTTFDTVPDAPISKFVLSMQGGKKGLLENSRNLCGSVNRATVEMTGQNGAPYDSRPTLKSKCKKPKGGKRPGRGRGGKKG